MGFAGQVMLPPMHSLTRALLGLAIGLAATIAAAGVYTEAHRAPDQP
jgi:hypothetical protein